MRDVAIEFVGADIIRPQAATWGGPYGMGKPDVMHCRGDPNQIDPERQCTREARGGKEGKREFDRCERQRAEDAAAPSSCPRRTNLNRIPNVRSGSGSADPGIFGYFPSMESTSPGGEISPVCGPLGTAAPTEWEKRMLCIVGADVLIRPAFLRCFTVGQGLCPCRPVDSGPMRASGPTGYIEWTFACGPMETSAPTDSNVTVLQIYTAGG